MDGCLIMGMRKYWNRQIDEINLQIKEGSNVMERREVGRRMWGSTSGIISTLFISKDSTRLREEERLAKRVGKLN